MVNAMEKYNEIIRASLIDFEEIKFILANNNIELISSNEIKENYYLKNGISLKNANYNTLIDKSYILANINDKLYLINKEEDGISKSFTKLEIVNENECVEFLNHAGFKEAFTIEKNIYTYRNNDKYMDVINLIGIGIFLGVRRVDSSEDELITILDSFNLPYNDKENNIVIEKLVLNKLRRYIKWVKK